MKDVLWKTAAARRSSTGSSSRTAVQSDSGLFTSAWRDAEANQEEYKTLPLVLESGGRIVRSTTLGRCRAPSRASSPSCGTSTCSATTRPISARRELAGGAGAGGRLRQPGAGARRLRGFQGKGRPALLLFGARRAPTVSDVTIVAVGSGRPRVPSPVQSRRRGNRVAAPADSSPKDRRDCRRTASCWTTTARVPRAGRLPLPWTRSTSAVPASTT